jgi:hypothetical protein
MQNRKSGAPEKDDIEVTPEMLDAGAELYEMTDYPHVQREMVQDIYVTMERVRRSEKPYRRRSPRLASVTRSGR